MKQKLHRKIGQVALERGFISYDTLCEAMLEVGRIGSEGSAPKADVWTEQRWLDGAQLAEVISEVGATASGGARRPDAVMQADELEEFVRAETAFLQGAPDSKADPDRTRDESDPFDRADTALAPNAEREELGEPSSIPFDDDEATFAEEDPAFDSQMNTLVRSQGAAAADPFGAVNATERVDGLPEESYAVGGDSDAQVALPSEKLLDPGKRFVLGDELGRGGGGRVIRAYDRVLGRTIAMKILRPGVQDDPTMLARFFAEAQATGQLEHPNIVPVYDFGVLPSGEFYYTMREVGRHSLREVFVQKNSGGEGADEDYSLVRMLSMLRQVCQAVQYAHTRGVIHRDLKPDNIMVGEYGEVLVMDWGLARVLDRQVRTDLSRQGGEERPVGETLGTPAYMPPEQARGELGEVDELSDVYSLGAILYEMLTLQPPYLGSSAEAIMLQVVEGELVVPSERAGDGRVVPDALERICLEAMAADKEQRCSSARQLSERLGEWLEGIQPREADRRVQRGEEAAERYRDLLSEVDEYEARVARLAAGIESFEPIDHKRELWRSEDRRDQLRTEAVRAFGDAVAGYTQALAHQPDHPEAKQGLADLYFVRLQRAEARGDDLDTIYYRALVRQYDAGQYAGVFAQEGGLEVHTEPSGANATLFAFEEIDRRLVAGDDTDLEQTPVERDAVPVGSYLLVLDHPDRRPVRVPVLVERGRQVSLSVRLPRASEVEDGFVFVPGGEYISGGDPDSFDPRAPKREHVDAFFCAKFPVTFGEYLEWINELHQDDPDQASAHAPQTRDADGMLVRFDEQRGLWVPDEILIEGAARQMYPIGEGHEYDLPVVGVSAFDAQAYCDWRGERDGRDFRLPGVDELEKAARGVDKRYFPWGNRFDATFCKMRSSRPQMSQLEPVGVFVDDVSPYGVRDLAGGVRDWCRATGDDQDQRPVFGGAWNLDERGSRMASRISILAEGRATGVGFRLAYSAG